MDDGTPVTALDVSGQAVRDFNHRRQRHVHPIGPAGATPPTHTGRSLTELTY